MEEKIAKGCIGCVASIIFCLFAIVLGPMIDYQIGLFKISLRLDIEPTTLALTNYFEETFVPGTPRDELNALLQSSGAFRVKVVEYKNDNVMICDAIVYFIGYWPLNRLRFHLCYDQQQQLESYKLINEDD